jgi:hypothetical protein
MQGVLLFQKKQIWLQSEEQLLHEHVYILMKLGLPKQDGFTLPDASDVKQLTQELSEKQEPISV